MTDYYFHFDLPGENWRATDVDGYFISDLGRLASARRPGPGNNIDMAYIKLRSLKPGSGGYIRFGLAGETRYIHRLVATAFLPEPPAGSNDVEFHDDDLTNCRATNLAWKGVTPRIEGGPSGKKLSEPVVRALRRDFAQGLTTTEAAIKFGVSRITAFNIKTGRTWAGVH